MADQRAFIDTNVLLYLLSEDQVKADKAEAIVAVGGVVSIQVLNEFAAVTSRKLGMKFSEIRECLEPLRTVLQVEPLTVSTHEAAINLAERYGLSFYDAVIVAAARLADCGVLYSEDLQHGQVFEKAVTVRNPFR